MGIGKGQEKGKQDQVWRGEAEENPRVGISNSDGWGLGKSSRKYKRPGREQHLREGKMSQNFQEWREGNS